MRRLQEIICFSLLTTVIGNQTTTSMTNVSIEVLPTNHSNTQIMDTTDNQTAAKTSLDKISSIKIVNINGINFTVFVVNDNQKNEDDKTSENTTLSKSLDVLPNISKEPSSKNCNYSNYDGRLHVFCYNVSIYEIAETLPAHTKSLDITKGHSMSTLNKSILSHLKELENLRITTSKVRFILPRFFTGLTNLRNLNLQDNHIRVIKTNTFEDTPNLENVNLRANFIIRIKTFAEALRHLKNLKTLDLAQNLILERITTDSFLPLSNSNLEELNLAECQIREIHVDAFTPLKNLRILDISTNSFTAKDLYNLTLSLEHTNISSLSLKYLPDLVRTVSFPTRELGPLQYTSIESLDLSFNTFRNIPNYAFANMTKLKYLTMAGCGIEGMQPNSLDYVPSLIYLDLRENKMPYISSSIKALSSLEHLIMKNVQRNDQHVRFLLEPKSFLLLKKLKILDLYFVPIAEDIKQDIFLGLSKLEDLKLGSCSIPSFADFSLKDLESLVTLDISYNLITNVTNNTFSGLRNLKLLHLNGNSLNIAPNTSPFRHLKSLESLFLNANKISYIYPDTFLGLESLTFLHLGNNAIKPWSHSVLPPGSLVHSYELVLILYSNEISHVTPVMLQEFQELQVLDIRNNPFVCDVCGMKEFQDWLITTTNTTIASKGSVGSDKDAYNCAAPAAMEGYSIFNVTIPTEQCYPKALDVAFIVTTSVVIPVMLIGIVLSVAYYLRWYLRYWIFLMRSNVRKYRMSVNERHYEYDAFVSYCATESQWVIKQLVPTLEGQNYNLKLCLHERDFEVGRLITDNIMESIEKSRKTILVLSDAYVSSKWCMLELHMAQHRLFDETRDALVLVELKELDKGSLPKTLKYLVKTRTYIQWTTNPIGQKLFWERLKEALRRPSDTFELKRIV